MVAKTTLVEQLTKRGSERQLELDHLRAQNKLLLQLQSRVSESARQVHGMEASVSKASLRSTTVTSNVAGLTLGTYSSPSRSTEGADMTELPTPISARRDGVSVGALNAERFHTGLNVSATHSPCSSTQLTRDQLLLVAPALIQAAAYNMVPPPLDPLSTSVLSGSQLSMHGSTVPGNSVVMHTGVNHTQQPGTANWECNRKGMCRSCIHEFPSTPSYQVYW